MLKTAGKDFKTYKREQIAISLRRIFPVTILYTSYSAVLLFVGLRTGHPLAAIGFYLAGIPVWTLVEYSSHRYVFHGRFKKPANRYKFYKTLANKYLDPLHWEHHERPFDGYHISGEWQDLLPLFVVAAPASFIFPAYSAPMLLAGVVQCYVIEEWIHHSIHFYNFRNPYWRYVKKHHLYHHTSAGMNRGYGISNGIWDVVFKTRFPENVRLRLSSKKRASASSALNIPPEGSDISSTRTF